MEEDRYTRITLRIPKDVHTNLQASADARSHSMNAEIVSRLEDSFNSPSTERVNELELQLAMQRAETFKERNTALKYSFAFMVVAERLPPSTFSDNPIIENLLAEARKDKALKVESALLQMEQDAKQAYGDLKEGVAARRIKVISEEEKAEGEPQEHETIEVSIRGKKKIFERGPDGFTEKPAKQSKSPLKK